MFPYDCPDVPFANLIQPGWFAAIPVGNSGFRCPTFLILDVVLAATPSCTVLSMGVLPTEPELNLYVVTTMQPIQSVCWGLVFHFATTLVTHIKIPLLDRLWPTTLNVGLGHIVTWFKLVYTLIKCA